ncbi:MAG: tRNA nucleotidyltransferase, partial [Oscillospiraceae bacterium]
MRLIIPLEVNAILEALSHAGFAAFPVGGCVRDALLGLIPSDWDITTAATPREVLSALSNFRVIPTGLRHGTITALSGCVPIEITTFRTDGTYSDGRHPDDVNFSRLLSDDLVRRDFTINAMALAPNGDIIDLCTGQADLAAGIIRAVGDPDRRFQEDALRILRALRFASRLGFTIETCTAQSLCAHCERLRFLSVERVFSELKQLLCGRHAAWILREFRPVFQSILPEMFSTFSSPGEARRATWCWALATRAVEHAPNDLVLRLTALFWYGGRLRRCAPSQRPAHSVALADALLSRLRCDNATKRGVTTLLAAAETRFSPDRTLLLSLLLVRSESLLRALLALQRATHPAHDRRLTETAQLLDDVLASRPCLMLRDLAVNGHDLMALGLSG